MKLKSRFTALFLAMTMILGASACSSGSGTASAVASSEAQAPASSASDAWAASSEGSSGTASVPAGYALKPGKYVIGLSNSFYGNTWRKQMVSSFTQAAEEAKKEGYISGYEIQNGDNTVNTQIAQINSFILKKVDAICINAASSTALNDVIKKAMDQGIKIIAFDSIINLDGAYTMDYDWVSMGEKKTQFVMDSIGGKGNVIVVRGPSGGAPDAGIYKGIKNILAKYPNVKVAAEVQGQADATVTQQGILNVLSSLPKIDAVITHCGADSMGVVNAFKSMNMTVPLTIGDNTAEFMSWWNQQAKESSYKTMSVNSTPSCGAGALWVSLAVLNGLKVPQKMYLPFIYINQDQIGQYANLQAGTIASPYMSYDYVVKNILTATA